MIYIPYIILAVAFVLAALVVGHLTEKDANKRVRLERERCARLALALRPHATDTAERMASEHHAARIHAAILGRDAPVRRTPTVAGVKSC